VVGYGILPEEEDRPGAHDLKREIVSRGLGEGRADEGRAGKARALWGMDHEATREVVERFVKDGFLDRFLDAVWKRNN